MRTKWTVRVTWTNWTFGVWWLRGRHRDGTAVGVDVGPIEVTIELLVRARHRLNSPRRPLALASSTTATRRANREEIETFIAEFVRRYPRDSVEGRVTSVRTHTTPPE